MESLDKNHDYHCHLHKGESSKRQGARGGGVKSEGGGREIRGDGARGGGGGEGQR